VDLADAIVADLAGQEFGIVIPWERNYGDWDLPLTKLELRGDVVQVMDGDVQLGTRGTLEFEASIVIAVRKKFDSQADIEAGRIYRSEIDKLVNAMEAVLVHVAKRRQIDDAAYKADKSKQVRAWHDRDALRHNSQFTGMIRVPYRVVKSLA